MLLKLNAHVEAMRSTRNLCLAPHIDMKFKLYNLFFKV